MKRHTFFTTCITTLMLTVLATSTSLAQCNRGGGGSRGRSTSGPTGAQFTSSNLDNPYGNSLSQLQLQSALAQQQRANIQQLMYRQALAQQQRRNSAQLARRGKKSRNTSLASNPSTSRRDRMRLDNAKKAYALAMKAERKGRVDDAEDYYERVIRIVGSSSPLGNRAADAIAALSTDDAESITDTPSSVTMLASIE